MLKHIIFDFDGTIADSSDIGLQIFNHLAEKYKFKKLTLDELRLINGLPIKERFKKVGVPLYKMPQIFLDSLAQYRILINSLKNFDGIKNLLVGLKKEGLSLSIISSNSAENIESFLKKHELEYFDNIFSVNNIFGKDKAIRNFLNKFNLNVDEIIYIGDELRDIEACKKVTVRIIAVIWGFDSIELLISGKPDFISHKPEDIITIVKSLCID